MKTLSPLGRGRDPLRKQWEGEGMRLASLVIPAQAGISGEMSRDLWPEIPASAGMTNMVRKSSVPYSLRRGI